MSISSSGGTAVKSAALVAAPLGLAVLSLAAATVCWLGSLLCCLTVCFLFVFFNHFYFPAQLVVGGFTLSDLLEKSWSQVSSLPPGTRLHFYRA